MTKDEALNLAFDALSDFDYEKRLTALTAIKAALAQPAQGWKLREVYFDEHGEPTMHKEPAQEPDRQTLQANGTHPAPCARHCEAQAFKVEIRNLKAQLAQPAQEPESECNFESVYQRGYLDGIGRDCPHCKDYRAMYIKVRDELAAEQQVTQRPWVGLTDEERRVCTQSPFTDENYRDLEAKLKEKNT